MAEPATIKSDWYQTEVTVVVLVLVKNVKKEDLDVNFSDRALTINLKVNEQHHNLLYNLSHKIVPEYCNYNLMPSKIEIKLKKAEDIRWANLECSIEKDTINNVSQGWDKPPSYPSSKGTDWNEVAKEIAKEEANEKPESDEALNNLFKEIYGKGSDEVKKAMNKSYFESGGTVLSTNWNEIAKDKVDIKPPDGMEFKKWDS